MTQIELLKAATPGKWNAYSYEILDDLGKFICHLNGWVNEKRTKANAELLRQAKVNALLVECAKQGWDIRELGGNSGVRFEADDCQHESSWPGQLHEMPEGIFRKVLAELEGKE